MNYELSPGTFPEANSTLIGRPIAETEKHLSKSEAVKDIPCFKEAGVVITRWTLPGFWARVKFLIKGEVYLKCLGESQPPISITIDSPFEITAE